jgi:hypothetical protein
MHNAARTEYPREKKENMSYSITETNGYVTVELTKIKKFDIEIDQFRTTRNLGNGLTNCCDLFIHTKQTKKKWVDDNLFYELALIINREISDHKINWVNTFIAIEQENYADHLISEEDHENGVDVFDNMDKVFEDSQTLNDEFKKREVRSGLREQVEERLREKRVIS